MMRLSRFEGMAVVSEAGERLGHVWEIRSPHWSPTEPKHKSRPVDALVCGRKGLLERLGWREATALAIPWRAVIGRRRGALLVRGKLGDYDRVGRARRKK